MLPGEEPVSPISSQFSSDLSELEGVFGCMSSIVQGRDLCLLSLEMSSNSFTDVGGKDDEQGCSVIT